MKARIKETGEVCDVLSVFMDKENGRYGFFSLDEIEIIPDEPETISDSHGNTWSKKCDVCGNDMQVVRPGSAICVKCNDDILTNDGMPVGHPLG